MEGCEKN